MKTLTLLVSMGALCISLQAMAEHHKVGATLNKKQALAVNEIPADVLAAIKPLAPDLAIAEAEKEWKHGNVYIDVEGTLPNVNEIEFDLLHSGDTCQVVEVQRDLTWDTTPKNVRDALVADSPRFKAKRIIESVQHDQNITVYEFYSVDADGKESRKEVKVEAGKAEVLQKEWQH